MHAAIIQHKIQTHHLLKVIPRGFVGTKG